MTESSLGLNTSKRKFYKLLDNLSSSKVQASVDKNATGTEQPTKRFRVLTADRPTTAPSIPARPSTSGARERPRSGIFGVHGTGKPRRKSIISESDVSTEQQKKTPNYAPWSHDQFLERLKTFADVRSWTPKPVDIGEVEWAKRGWTLVAKDTVGCKGGCEKRLVVKIAEEENRKPKEGEGGNEDDDNEWWMGDLEKEMANKYSALIVEAHAEDCLWKRAGCKDDIYRIKMADPATWQTELRERYLSLLVIEDSLPAKLDLQPQDEQEGYVFSVNEVAELVPPDVTRRRRPSSVSGGTTTEITDVVAQEEPNNNINTTALTMALIGWSGQSQNNVQLAYCTKCFQRAGLWLYKPKTSTNDSSASLTESFDLLFNPTEQHREHCPWKNPTTQCALGRLEGKSGWQVLVALIKGYRRHERSPSKKAPSRPVSSYTESTGVDEDEESFGKSREEQDKEDKERRSRLQKLKRAFTVKRGSTLSKASKD